MNRTNANLRRFATLALIGVLVATAVPSSVAQRRTGGSRKLDTNLRIGDRGYNRRVQPRHNSMRRPVYTVSSRGDLRYNERNAFGRERRYRPSDARNHYDSHIRARTR